MSFGDFVPGMPQPYTIEGVPIPYDQYANGPTYAMQDGSLRQYPQDVNKYNPILDQRMQTVAQFQQEQMYQQDMQRRMQEGWASRQQLGGVSLSAEYSARTPNITVQSMQQQRNGNIARFGTEYESPETMEKDEAQRLADSVAAIFYLLDGYSSDHDTDLLCRVISQNQLKLMDTENEQLRALNLGVLDTLVSYYRDTLPDLVNSDGKADEYRVDDPDGLLFFNSAGTVRYTSPMPSTKKYWYDRNRPLAPKYEDTNAYDSRRRANYMTIGLQDILRTAVPNSDALLSEDGDHEPVVADYRNYWLNWRNSKLTVDEHETAVLLTLQNDEISDDEMQEVKAWFAANPPEYSIELMVKLGNSMRTSADAVEISPVYVVMMKMLASSDSLGAQAIAREEMTKMDNFLWSGSEQTTHVDTYLRWYTSPRDEDDVIRRGMIRLNPNFFELFAPRQSSPGQQEEDQLMTDTWKEIHTLEGYAEARHEFHTAKSLAERITSIDMLADVINANDSPNNRAVKYIFDQIGMNPENVATLITVVRKILATMPVDMCDKFLPTILNVFVSDNRGDKTPGGAGATALYRSTELLKLGAVQSIFLTNENSFNQQECHELLEPLLSDAALTLKSLSETDGKWSADLKRWTIDSYADYYWSKLLPRIGGKAYVLFARELYPVFVDSLFQKIKKHNGSTGGFDMKIYDKMITYAIATTMPDVENRGPRKIPNTH